MRILIKIVLQKLAQWAIKKHEIELIIVNGLVGQEIVKEGIYSILSEKFVVRRNFKTVWWDLSLPLNILGYEDKQRNPLEWNFLIVRSLLVILLGRKNKHTLIISADSSHSDTANYWSKFIKPSMLVIVDLVKDSPVTKNLIEVTKKAKGKIIIPAQNSFKIPKSLVVKFGVGEDSNFKVKRGQKFFSVLTAKKSYKFKYQLKYPNEEGLYAAIIATCISWGIDHEDLISGMLKFDIKDLIFSKISKSLES